MVAMRLVVHDLAGQDLAIVRSQGVNPGVAIQQPYDFREVAPFLGIIRLLTCEVGTMRLTSEALVRLLMLSSWHNKCLFSFSPFFRYMGRNLLSYIPNLNKEVFSERVCLIMETGF